MEKQIELAIAALLAHEPVVIPTETVYGLAARIFDEEAVAKIYRLKKRPRDNPLIAHIGMMSQIQDIAVDIPQDFYTLAEAFFPGPLTVVLKRHSSVPSICSGGLDTIAVRMPCHPIALELIKRIGEPLVAPSANISGKPSPTCVEHVYEDFQGQVPCIIDGGPCVYGLESTVVSLVHERPTLLRPGEISKKKLEERLQKTILIGSVKEKLSPGICYPHYAPSATISLFYDLEELKKELKNRGENEKIWVLSREDKAIQAPLFQLSRSQLYSLFRKADQAHCNKIFIYVDEVTKLDFALMNRLQKAASSSSQFLEV